MQIFDETSKIMRNDRISSGFSVKILSNDVIQSYPTLICINYANMHIANISFVFHCFYSYVF